MIWLLLALLTSIDIFAADWWSSPRTEDENYFYYVGLSEGKQGIAKIQEQAVNKAMGDLIREHFGMNVQVSESSVEEYKKDSFQVVTKQSSAPLFIKGITVTKVFEKETDDGINVYVQLRVEKKALKEAVEHQSSKPQEESLNTYGGAHASKVDFKIKTHPQGALITFTHLDQRLSLQGYGDALFYLPRGRYQMAVSSPGYITDLQEILIQTGGREEEVKLQEDFFDLNLHTTPQNASVTYAGVETSETEYKLPVGKIHRFKISHPDYLSQEIEVQSHESGQVIRNIILEPKSSSIELDIYPSRTFVEIDGVPVKLHNGKIHLTPGTKTIRISAHRYFPYEEKLVIAPNREYPKKVIHLKYDDINLSPSDKGLSYRFEYNPFIYQEEVGLLAFVPLSFHLEYHYLSIGAGYSWANQTEEKKNEVGLKVKKEDNYYDYWGAVRLITPKLGRFKFFASGVAGKVLIDRKDWGEEKGIKTTKSYTGTGGGFRFYFKPRWSFQAEYLKLHTVESETKLKAKQDRVQLGISFEF